MTVHSEGKQFQKQIDSYCATVQQPHTQLQLK